MEQAFALDPNYDLAWSGLADAYTVLGCYSQLSPEEVSSNARRCAIKALEAGPDLGEGHGSWRQADQLPALPEFQEILETLKFPGWHAPRAGELRTGHS